jgi:hypothetical protein
MAAVGIPEDAIALVIGISPKTLRRHYRIELSTGQPKANAKVAGNLYRIATGDGRGAVAAAIWWTKARMGWREQSNPEAPGIVGKKQQAIAAAAIADDPAGEWAHLN